ncbi:YSC84-like protein [Fusarium sp. NRRL 52700]|nr:YSC84-like protein [Fusarium sp. NRRL 52700]
MFAAAPQPSETYRKFLMTAARKKKLSISVIAGSSKKENMKGNGRSNGTGGGGWSFGRWGSTKTASTNTTNNLFSQSKPKSKSKSKSKSVPEHKHQDQHKHPPGPARTLLSIPPSSTRQFGFGAVSFSSSLPFSLPFSRFSCRRLQFGPQETPRHCSPSLRLQFRLLCLFLLDYSIIYTNIIIRLAHYHRNNNPGLVSCLRSVHFRSSTTIISSSNNNSTAPCIPVLSVVPPPGQDGGDGEARRPAMQRVSSFLPSWDKRSSGGSRAGLFGWSSNRSSTSISVANSNALARLNTAAANTNGRVQREAFWPATLDLECEKAARILKSFCTDGYLVPLEEEEDAQSTTSEPRSPKRVTKKIPKRIIQNAAGIAIFTCMRSGLYMTGSGGSGILIARKSDGTWSPPSGIMLHTPTLSFIIGVDVYDCVLVINNLAALESITKPRVTLGEDVGLTSGPLVSLDSDESHIKWNDLGNTVLTYLKARGQNQVVNLNGCILAERGNENERFYANQVTQMDILAGNVSRQVEEVGPLSEVIKMAEGRTDYDASVMSKIAAECAPGDAMIATPKSSTPASPRTAFGIPNIDDPDPFGVLALEMAGLEIREAGSRLRPTSSQFDFNPAPTSPAFSKFNRQSIDTFVSRSNRNSYMSSRTVKSQMTDAGTQTDVGTTPETTPSPGQSEDGFDRSTRTQIPEVTEEEEEVDYTKVDLTPIRHLSGAHTPLNATGHSSTTAVEQDTLKVEPRDDTDKASSNYDSDRDDKSSRKTDNEGDSESEVEEEEEEEEPVVFEVAAVQPARTQAVASRMIHAKGNMVTIGKRIPPPLPMRSPARTSRSSKSEIGDVSNLRSPLRKEAFSEEDLASEDEQTKSDSSPYLKPQEFKVEKVRVETKKAEEPKSEEPKIDETKAEKPEAKEAKVDEVKADIAKTGEPQAKQPTTEPAKIEEPEEEAATEFKAETKDTQTSPTLPQTERPESPVTPEKKHTSSIYTGVTDDRWSVDGSTLTTPTSDRPCSIIDDVTEDMTPRKPSKEVEPTKEAEPTELNEKHEDLKKITSNETTPNTITVV